MLFLYFTEIDLEGLDTAQSSVKFDGTSDLAIDGNDNPDFDEGDSCIVTDAGIINTVHQKISQFMCFQ